MTGNLVFCFFLSLEWISVFWLCKLDSVNPVHDPVIHPRLPQAHGEQIIMELVTTTLFSCFNYDHSNVHSFEQNGPY